MGGWGRLCSSEGTTGKGAPGLAEMLQEVTDALASLVPVLGPRL